MAPTNSIHPPALPTEPTPDGSIRLDSGLTLEIGDKNAAYDVPCGVVPDVCWRGPETKEAPARPATTQIIGVEEEFLAEVEPPSLGEGQLQNSQVVPSRHHLLRYLPRGGVCAEIGTQTGYFAKHILAALQPSRFHIYDLDFTPFDHAYFQRAIKQGVVCLHQGDSATLLAATPDRHFDFIYIDGDHSYEWVVRDLEQAGRKIKEDGWIVCNDYTVFSPLEKIKYGVYRAVNEFCLKWDYEIVYLGLHPWGYHDVALRKRRGHGGNGAVLDTPEPRSAGTAA
jgi:hypothetical protein